MALRFGNANQLHQLDTAGDMVLAGVALGAVSVMALTGFASSAALAVLIATGGLMLPPWGIAADPRVAQATSLKNAGLDAEKVKQLDAEVEQLYEAGKYAEATAIAERSLAWREVEGCSNPSAFSIMSRDLW